MISKMKQVLKVKKAELDEKSIIEVSLNHVRAANDIRIEYDFERDGYKILTQYVKEDENGEIIEVDEKWTEVAFIDAWCVREDG
jgi:hypothetical protein